MKLPLGFDMTTTRADFRRLLPAAVAHAPFVEEGEAFVHRENGRGWRIALTPLPKLEIGLIRLERHRVEFGFSERLEIVSQLIKSLANCFVQVEVDQTIAHGPTQKKLKRQVIDALDVLIIVSLLGFDPTLKHAVSQ